MRTTIHRRNFFFYFLDTARDRPVLRHRNKTTGELNLLYGFVTVFIFHIFAFGNYEKDLSD